MRHSLTGPARSRTGDLVERPGRQPAGHWRPLPLALLLPLAFLLPLAALGGAMVGRWPPLPASTPPGSAPRTTGR